jgi:hypothetical protein
MVKAARVFRRRAICVAISLTSVFTLRASLGRVIKKMLRFGTKNKRKKTPSTLSILAQELISYDEEDKLDLAA